ncbi:MAG: energy transducer TonB [Ignavibacteriales bacterium]|nr:energy transducer TonB [Ignavibacteriales bacterium]MCB9207796.1 energy transducer TonB [Ignavibacteriales bacterium]
MEIISTNYKPKSEAYYFFKSILYVSELGKLEKIKFTKEKPYKDFGESEINPNFENLIAPLTKYLSTVKFKPALLNSKEVKSQFLWEASVRVDSAGKAEIYIGALELNGLKSFLNFNRDEYFVMAEEMPSPIGGMKAIQEKIKYPELARRAGIEGRVYIKAFIDENGNVASAEVIKGLEGGCNEAAIEAVKNTKFIPGRQRGKAVKVQVSIPILFKLDISK